MDSNPDQEKKPARSKLRIALYVVGFLTLAGIVTAAVFGGYPRLYRAFLQAPAKAHYAKRLKDVSGIEYIARIDQGLYRGAYPRDHLEVLKKLGIRTLINFRYMQIHDYRDQAEAMGFKYFWIPLHPGEPPTPDQIKEFLAIVKDPANQPVYIHCTLGIDRTGVMAGIYRIEQDGWSNLEAVAEMEYFGHNELWMDLEEFLKTYTPRLKE